MSQSDSFEREKIQQGEPLSTKENIGDSTPYTKLDILSLIRKIKLKARDVLDTIASHERSKTPQHALLGSIEVTEDVQKDLLTPRERSIYQNNFHILEQITAGADEYGKLVLSSPGVMAAIVGLHPLYDVEVDEKITDHTGNARVIVDSFRNAGIDFDAYFSFLTNTDGSVFLMNDKAIQYLLEVYQNDLGVDTHALQSKDQLIQAVNNLLQSDPKKAHTAFGIFSGFPVPEVRAYVNAAELSTLFSLNRIPSHEIGPPNPALLRTDTFGIYEDTLTSTSANPTDKSAGGFGVRWTRVLPNPEFSILHGQKLLQVNRELGLSDWQRNVRSSLDISSLQGSIQTAQRSISSTT